MTPKRISAKFYLSPDPSADVDLDPFIGLFHRMIQNQSAPGLLIDVADYIHVPDGPGVILIGHDVDYGMDLTEGQAGLLATRKRIEEGSLTDLLEQTVGMALGAIQAIAADGEAGVAFATNACRIQLLDRLVSPNTDQAFSEAKGAFEALASKLYSGAVDKVARVGADDARGALGAEIVASEDVSIDTLIARLS
jgi:hypothetical protein